MTIEFLPSDAEHRDVGPALRRVLMACQSVEGSVAYWTLPTDALGGQLLTSLRKPGSCICVDLGMPTDLNCLAEYVTLIQQTRTEPALYLYVKKHSTQGRGQVASKLHTKLLLFDMGNEQWEIWIGSHNFTKLALHGGNLEAGIRIVGQADEPNFRLLLDQVQDYLCYIRNDCWAFDPAKLTLYESLRGDLDDKDLIDRLKTLIKESNIIVSRVLTLQSTQADRLGDQTIILLGNLTEELAAIRFRNRGGSPVILRMRDIHTGQIYSYRALLRANDLINNVPSFDVSFNQRRWAIRKVKLKGEAITPPLLQQARDVDAQLIRDNRYYVNVEIQELINNYGGIDYYTYPETDTVKLWRVEYNDRIGRPIWGFPSQYEKAEVDMPVSLVPVEHAEVLTQIRPVDWTDDFTDGLLEKRIIVFKQSK